MKKLLIIVTLIITHASFCQVSGNINYLNQFDNSNNAIDIKLDNNNDIIINVKGLHNVEADTYVATFSIIQVGKTMQETEALFHKRVGAIQKFIATKPTAKLIVDMISFVPVYEYEAEHKLFSKKTYNEIPKGFELTKNLHISYKNPELLKEIIRICAKSEIYNLVKVDYFSEKLATIKTELAKKAQALAVQKMKNYQTLLQTDFSTLEKDFIEGYKVSYPVESYQSFQAHNSSSLNLKKKGNLNNIKKSNTLFYQPISNKDYDFVENPVILSPVIQVSYQLKIRIKQNREKAKDNYVLITPSGDLKNIHLNKTN